jgi:hypothetical protein
MNKELTQISIFLVHLETEATMRSILILGIVCSINLCLNLHRQINWACVPQQDHTRTFPWI